MGMSPDDRTGARSADEEETTETSGASRSYLRRPSFAFWSLGSADQSASDGYETPATDRDDETWVDEGLISLLIIAGAVLLLFPEPTTSFVGVLLLLAGAVLWILDWMV